MTRARRRENGEGSAYRLADGRWRAEVTIGWEPGPNGSRHRVRRYVYGQTEAEAKYARNELLRRKAAGELGIGGRATVEAWLTHWLEVICPERNLTPNTLASYRVLIEQWINPVIGHLRLHDVGPDDVEAVYARMRVAGRAPSYVRGCHRVLSRALKVAMRRRRIAVNPCDMLDAPSVPDTEADAYTPDEARSLAQAAAERPGGARWTIGLALGIRQGEALGLLREKVDLDAGTIRVDRQLARRRKGDVGPRRLARVKSRAGNRTITIPRQLIPVLRAHLAQQAAARIAMGEKWRGCGLVDVDGEPVGSELVFAGVTGRPIDHAEDWRDWCQLVDEAGVRYINPHGARHTAATLMLVQGVQPRVAAAILGHSSTELFNSTYSHVVAELHRDAADRIGAALFDHDGVIDLVGTMVGTDRDSRGRLRKPRTAEAPNSLG